LSYASKPVTKLTLLYQQVINSSTNKQQHISARIADSNFYGCVCQGKFYFFIKKWQKTLTPNRPYSTRANNFHLLRKKASNK